jgi:hypothetical protein
MECISSLKLRSITVTHAVESSKSLSILTNKTTSPTELLTSTSTPQQNLLPLHKFVEALKMWMGAKTLRRSSWRRWFKRTKTRHNLFLINSNQVFRVYRMAEVVSYRPRATSLSSKRRPRRQCQHAMDLQCKVRWLTINSARNRRNSTRRATTTKQWASPS